MRAFSRLGHFRSRDKDGGHTIRSVIAENPCCTQNVMALCFIDNFCSCDLDLDPMTFIDALDPYPLEIYRICENELPIRQGFPKFSYYR